MTCYVSYCRVSTGRQERSGLGIEAQQEAVRRYVSQTDSSIIAEYIETESGAKSDRPQLAKALAHCRRAKATLLIARLDRLSRSLSFVAQLLDANVEIRCADMPEANRLLLQMLAVFGEHERQMIRERTRAALAAAKARGTVLGANGKVLAAKHRAEAQVNAQRLRPAFEQAQTAGCVSLPEIADYLTAQGHKTASGGRWHPMTVRRVLDRLAASA
jgi:DNA invertase Pin-like site-specific DNA recombinase